MLAEKILWCWMRIHIGKCQHETVCVTLTVNRKLSHDDCHFWYVSRWGKCCFARLNKLSELFESV